MNYNKIFVLLLFLILPSLFLFADQTKHKKKKKKVLIIVINNISFNDIVSFDTFKQLFEISGIGLMNTNLGGRDSNVGYLTIGTSSRSIGSNYLSDGFTHTEYYKGVSISEIYYRRVGKTLPEGAIAQVNIEKIKKINSKSYCEVYPGLLGKLLIENGLKTACLGNSDTDETVHRESVNILMNEDGIVTTGDVSKNILIEDNNAPFGIRTNFDKLLKEFIKIKEKADVIVIETGDTSRLNKFYKFASERIVNIQKQIILGRIDKFLRQLLSYIDYENTLLLIITPSPAEYATLSSRALTPIIICKDGKGSGLLTSSTTNQIGIVTTLDIAPTILSYLGLPIPKEIYGTQIKFISTSSTYAKNKIVKLEKKIANLETQQMVFVKLWIIFMISTPIISFLFLLINKIINRQDKIFCYLLLYAAFLPISSLFQSLIFTGMIVANIIILLVLNLLIILLIGVIIKNYLHKLLVVALLTSIILLIDSLTGFNLIKYSILGFSISAGKRFYGLGNEYGALLIFSTIIATTLLYEITNKNRNLLLFLISLYYLSILIIFFHTDKGANLGCGITAILSFGITYFLLNKKIDKKLILFIFILLQLSVIYIVFNWYNEGPDSHITRVIHQISNKEFEPVIKTIIRRWNINKELVTLTPAIPFMLTCFGLITFVLFLPIKQLDNIKSKYTNLFNGLIAIIIGSIISFFINDSGIVVCTIGMTTLIITLIYLLYLEEDPHLHLRGANKIG